MMTSRGRAGGELSFSSSSSSSSSAAFVTSGKMMKDLQLGDCSSEHTASTMNTREDEEDERRHQDLRRRLDSHGSFLRRQVAQLAGQAAKKRLEDVRKSSRLTASSRSSPPLPRPAPLSWDDVFVEDMLGMGSFASVWLVACPKLRRIQQLSGLLRGDPNSLDCSESSSSAEDEPVMLSQSAMHESDESMMSSYESIGTSLSYGAATTPTGESVDPTKYYACKSLSNKTVQQENVRGFVAAAADLVHEAFLLSHISAHPNIVRLYGVPKGGGDDGDGASFDASLFADDDLGYFLLMEALTGGVLNDRLCEWRSIRAVEVSRARQLNLQDAGSPEYFLGGCWQKEEEHERSWTGACTTLEIPRIAERLDIALQVATGMQHLHAHGIVFRDLKPQNVGLSSRPPDGWDEDADCCDNLTWRLFDFGLAREVPAPSGGDYNSVVRGKAGSLRYMAPDVRGGSVVRGKAGSLRYMSPETMGGRYRRRMNSCAGCFSTFGSDVFSFAVLLWELVSLADFDHQFDHSTEEFETAVCERGHRPDINAAVGPDCPRRLRDLIEACWQEDYQQRPTFEIVIQTLQELISLASSSSTAQEYAKVNHLSWSMNGSLLPFTDGSFITMGSCSMQESITDGVAAVASFQNRDVNYDDQESDYDDDDESMFM